MQQRYDLKIAQKTIEPEIVRRVVPLSDDLSNQASA
jgi:hypothetical protein